MKIICINNTQLREEERISPWYMYRYNKLIYRSQFIATTKLCDPRSPSSSLIFFSIVFPRLTS